MGCSSYKKTNSLALFEGYSEKEYLPEKSVNLPNMTLGEELILDYQSLRLSLSTHPVKLLRPFLEEIHREILCRSDLTSLTAIDANYLLLTANNNTQSFRVSILNTFISI